MKIKFEWIDDGPITKCIVNGNYMGCVWFDTKGDGYCANVFYTDAPHYGPIPLADKEKGLARAKAYITYDLKAWFDGAIIKEQQ